MDVIQNKSIEYANDEAADYSIRDAEEFPDVIGVLRNQKWMSTKNGIR